MSKLTELAHACNNGACNIVGILRSLGEAVPEIPAGAARDSIESKIIVGQVSYLLGESAGPTSETIEAYSNKGK